MKIWFKTEQKQLTEIAYDSKYGNHWPKIFPLGARKKP